MPYKVELRPAARQGLRRLDLATRRRMLSALQALGMDPRPHGAIQLTGSERWRIRIGDYRVIYEPQDDRLVVLVIRIGHRRDVYRRL